MRHHVELAGLQLGAVVVVARSLIGRGSDGSYMWVCRCTVCGDTRKVSGNYICNLQRVGHELSCPRCRVANPDYRCRTCRRKGHHTSECHPVVRKATVCTLCASLPHRVQGIRCKRCRLRYEREEVPGVDYDARNASALARMIGGGP